MFSFEFFFPQLTSFATFSLRTAQPVHTHTDTHTHIDTHARDPGGVRVLGMGIQYRSKSLTQPRVASSDFSFVTHFSSLHVSICYTAITHKYITHSSTLHPFIHPSFIHLLYIHHPSILHPSIYPSPPILSSVHNPSIRHRSIHAPISPHVLFSIYLSSIIHPYNKYQLLSLLCLRQWAAQMVKTIPALKEQEADTKTKTIQKDTSDPISP